MAIEKYLEHLPKIDTKSYIANSAVVMGMVELGEGTSVWPNATLRLCMWRRSPAQRLSATM